MILNCGEALIDMLPRLTAAGEPAFLPCPGGAVFNTAVALGRLGVPSRFFSGISTDLMGRMLAGSLADAGVGLDHVVHSPRPTTLAFVTLHEGQARYAFYDENTAGRMIGTADLPDLDAPGDTDGQPAVQALFFGGISLVSDPAASAFEALQARESPRRITMLDPNIRPALLAGCEPEYRARIARMIGVADIVKVSDEDLRWLMGEGDTGDLARALLARGPDLVLVTEGPAGARAFTAGHELHRPAPQVTVADTVGAGDTFNAGVLAALYQAGQLTKAALPDLPQSALVAALDLGIASAAITVSRAGANPPWRHEIAGL